VKITQITTGILHRVRKPSTRHIEAREPQTSTGRHRTATPTRKHFILDEFSNLPISRQRKYQLRMQRDRRCCQCGMPAAHGLRCLQHLIQDREQTRKRSGYTRRYRRSITYRLEAELSRYRRTKRSPA